MREGGESRTGQRGRSFAIRASLVATAASIALAPRSASAQLDVNPPIPNVLLLVDTSGSMENMIDGSAPEDNVANKCVPNTTTPMNRWATLVSVLTGTIQNFSCYAQPRDATFASEYALSANAPYDQGYYLPFHRILSSGCTIGPGTAPTNYWDWPATAFKQHDYTNVNTACTSPFTQSTDGLLDTFRDRVRFGLMTFDTLPDQHTGLSGTSIDAPGGELGMWSYFPGWSGGGSTYAQGNPPNCALHEYEVGARNPAAPPWEGRLIPFGPYDASLTNVEQTNDQVQQAIVAMRPYGATPLAGMLTDAEYFLLNDPSTDPSTNKPFSQKDDPYFDGGCRKTFVLVLSDGEPNMDMKPDCAETGGVCPYAAPELITRALATNADPNKQILTYVVGFGLSSAGGFDCTTLTSADLTSSTCLNATGPLKACCELTAIAYNGGTNNAFFANDITGLRSQLSTVLAAISQGSTARTYPVFATASAAAGTGGNAAAAGYQFLSSFQAPAGGQLWSGNLERERYACQTTSGVLAANLQIVDPTKGDDFAANLNSNDGNHLRQFFSFVGAADSTGKIYSARSLRPGVTTDDGIGLSTGTTTNNGPIDGPTFSANLSATPQAYGIDPITPPATCNSTLKTTIGSICADRLMRWNIGVSNSPTLPDSRNPATCPAGTTCSMFGSIYHSTPAVMGAPLDYLQDESYSDFAAAQRLRESVLFTATTDGQLHAFKVAPGDPADSFKVDSLANNELWSFIPPVVLPSLLATYNQQSLLLDGAPVIRDVVFQRTLAQAQSGIATWNTVLVAGGGSAGGFYYALDVTNPATPKFLWQLSTDASNNPLFGSAVPQPGIATISYQPAGNPLTQVAVAILAGGTASLKSGTCLRQQAIWPKFQPTANYTIRNSVQCWGGATTVGPARSVTVVRLDTGQILATFRAPADGPTSLAALTVPNVKLDSPMTGIPVPYPSQVGQVADRAYIGDSDGTLWRIDFTNPDPTKWVIELGWDAYAMQTQFGDTAATGQPIQTTPIVSVDEVGNTVVLFSTGDQELFTTPTPVTRVWSLIEKPNGTTYKTSENWVIPFTNGKRVTGPMSLFNSVLYFGTFTPNATGVVSCSDGFGSVWGVDYTLGTAAAYGMTPNPQFVADPINAPTVKTQYLDEPAGTVVFGVGVTQTPACVDTTTYGDPYLGMHTAISQASAGAFQLVFETGKGGVAANGSKTNSVTQTLPTPRVSTRIDSWASIVE